MFRLERAHLRTQLGSVVCFRFGCARRVGQILFQQEQLEQPFFCSCCSASLLHHQISATCPVAALPLTRLEWVEDVQGDLLTLLTFYSNENDYCQGSSEPRAPRPHTDVVKTVAQRPPALEPLQRLKRSRRSFKWRIQAEGLKAKLVTNPLPSEPLPELSLANQKVIRPVT